MKRTIPLTFLLLANLAFLPGTAWSDVVTRIIDTGAGLATATRFDNGEIMVYDTGHWNHDPAVFTQFQNFIGDSDIDLLITSHSDSDHIAATDELFAAYRIHRVIRTGFERDGTATWEDHRDAIRTAARRGLTHDIDLRFVNLPHGTTYSFGDAVVTYLSGFHEPPAEFGIPAGSSEFRNGNSIVVRLDYQGNSILFTGDAVGRVEDTPPDAAAFGTERFLVDNRATRPIVADVLIVPHHGSDDGSSQEFIRHVGARWIIFPAGSANDHPKRVTAERFLTLGYTANCMLRTDLGDDEGRDEWNHGRINNQNDPIGDDDIEIRLPDNGSDPLVGYVGQATINCPPVDFGIVPVVVGDSEEVRKSRSGICHTTESRYYSNLVHFEEFASLDACLDSGGREL